MSFHKVKQGEHLTRIAEENGFSDFQTIWDHPENAELKRQRQNPNVLFPGDDVFIPVKELKEESGTTEKRHRFKWHGRQLKLHLRLLDIDKKPLANTECELHVDGKVHELTTDGNGGIEREIPTTAEHARLIFQDPKVPFDQILRVKIGHLDPVTQISGQIGRLNNLGYDAGDPAQRISTEAQQQFRSAVEEFQCDHGLTVTGKCDEATRKKLLEIHGC